MSIYRHWTFRTNAPITTGGQKVIVDDAAALEALVQKIKLPIKCFIVFGPKELRIQIIFIDINVIKLWLVILNFKLVSQHKKC